MAKLKRRGADRTEGDTQAPAKKKRKKDATEPRPTVSESTGLWTDLPEGFRWTAEQADRPADHAEWPADHADWLADHEEWPAEPHIASSSAISSEVSRKKVAPVVSLPQYKFAADPGDHAETPLDAYKDVEFILMGLAKALGKTRSQLRIWDPFYCQAGMKQHLAELGFTKVHNVNEDFYKVITDKDTIPKHDVLITNPPFSTGHVEKTLRFCIRNRKPWMLLMPEYVHGEPHFSRTFHATTLADTPMYLKPWRRYAYLRPLGLMKSGHQRATSITPFESLWYLNLFSHKEATLSEWRKAKDGRGCQLFETRDSLLQAPQQDQVARTEKRPNPKARKRAAQKINVLRR